MKASKSKKPSKVTIYDQKGRKAGECWLPAEIFHARVNHRLLNQVNRMYAANRRRGTASTKGRAEVRGGGRKPWKQKGTGRARTGSTRIPHWRGGGVVFGPTPREFGARIPVQLRRQALISALSQKQADGKLTLVDRVELSKPKTKEWMQILKSLKLSDRHTLCILHNPVVEQKRAAQNLKYRLRLEDAAFCSAYDVMKNDRLLLGKDALPVLESRLLGMESAEAKRSASRETKDETP